MNRMTKSARRRVHPERPPVFVGAQFYWAMGGCAQALQSPSGTGLLQDSYRADGSTSTFKRTQRRLERPWINGLRAVSLKKCVNIESYGTGSVDRHSIRLADLLCFFSSLLKEMGCCSLRLQGADHLPILSLAEWQINRSVASPLSQIEQLEPIAGWSPTEQIFTDWTPRFENPSVALQTTFGLDGRTVGLYVAYYRNQDYSRKMVSSSNVMVTSSNPLWARVVSGSRQIVLGERSVAVRSAELRSTDTLRMVVWQWYWINGHLTSSDFVAKAYTALSRLTGQGDDSAVIFVYAPKEQGEGVLEDFVKAAEPAITSALSRTREKR